MCQELGIESEVIPRIASGFAGGIGNTGAVCGAVSGAVMAIGLKQGRDALPEDGEATAGGVEDLSRLIETERDAPSEDQDPIWGTAQEFLRRFETEMGSISCRELTGADLSTAEGRTQFMNSDAPMTACVPAVGAAYRLVLELLKETP